MNRFGTTLLLATLTLALTATQGGAAAHTAAKPAAKSARAKTTHTGGTKVATELYAFKVKTIDGEERSLADFKGKTLLIVNTASECGNTPQYEGMEKLYEKYKARGFEVLAFPANNFGGQEPGSNSEIKTFCSTKYKTTFPLFAKISVKGKDIAPLYAYLTKDSGFPGDIGWNFAKFLVGPDGKVVARFSPTTQPLSSEVVGKIEGTLAAGTGSAAGN
jgi:glutathione peroxidase